jgi:hypothetical protein
MPRESADRLEELHRRGRVLLMSVSPARRAECARWLGASRCLSAYAYLRQAFWDPEEGVRISSVLAVGDLAVRQSGGELAALYAWSRPRVRRAILQTVERIGWVPGFDGILSMAAGDTDRRVRALAARVKERASFPTGRV